MVIVGQSINTRFRSELVYHKLHEQFRVLMNVPTAGDSKNTPLGFND